MYDQGRFFTVTETIAKALDRDDFYSPGAELAAPVQPRDGRELPPPDRPMAVARKLAADLFTNDAGQFTLRHWRGGWWRWHGPHWCEDEHRAVRADAYRYIPHLGGSGFFARE
jgi:hypothetical protein